MQTTRQNKVSRLIQKELSNMFIKNSYTNKPVMVSITNVTLSPDLAYAKIYLSVFPSKDKPEIVDIINNKKKQIRYEFGKKIRFQLRIVPTLDFYIDDSLDYIDNIEKLLQK